MFPFIIFTLAFGTVLGGALDQKVPEFNHAVKKYVVQADHNEPQPFEDKEGVQKR